MSRKPFDQHEQRVFLRTIVLASLAGCVGFTIFAMVRGDSLTTPVLGAFVTLIATGLVFGWFGKLDDEDRDGQ